MSAVQDVAGGGQAQGSRLAGLVRQRRRIVSDERHQGSGLPPSRQVARHSTAAPATSPAPILGLTARARVAPTDHALMARRSCPAHACRHSAVVCGYVELIATTDSRLGLTARERRSFTVRFVDRLDAGLRAELTELVRRRGAAARRAAERMQPIEVVFDDPLRGLQRITGWVQPPQRRTGDLRDIQFGLRAAAP